MFERNKQFSISKLKKIVETLAENLEYQYGTEVKQYAYEEEEKHKYTLMQGKWKIVLWHFNTSVDVIIRVHDIFLGRIELHNCLSIRLAVSLIQLFFESERIAYVTGKFHEKNNVYVEEEING